MAAGARRRGDAQADGDVIYFTMLPRDNGQWLASASRHRNVDRPDPR